MLLLLGTRNDENNEKEIIPLKAGDKLTPIYYIYGYDSDAPQIMEGFEMICTGNECSGRCGCITQFRILYYVRI